MAASRAPVSAAADGGIEANAMAILDSTGIKDSRDLHDDRLAFLEAVRSACLATGNPSAPSWRMCDAVFQILQNSSSLELAVASFHLLMELDKQYPRTYLTDSGGHQALVVVKESWLPFLLGSGAVNSGIGGTNHLFDPSKFLWLIEKMVEPSNATDVNDGIKAIENMMVLQYLVNTLEADFVRRHVAYKESLDWVIFRESLLNMLLGSRKLGFKSLVKYCMYLLLNEYHHEATDAVEDNHPPEGVVKSGSDLDSSPNYLSFEFESERTLEAVRKLFVMVMKLDLIRKEADTSGLTSRADGFRNPIMEVIVDELTYNVSYLSPFLLAFGEWKWKLEIILQYFSKYCGKLLLTLLRLICVNCQLSSEPVAEALMGAVRTRRSDTSQHDLKLESVLSSFLTPTSTKAIVKRMGSEVAQLLLAHAYQACLSVQGDSKDTTTSTEKIGATLQQISCNLLSAFQNLRKVNPDIVISPFEKEALFTAATLKGKCKSEELQS